jgi:hypothetical protein
MNGVEKTQLQIDRGTRPIIENVDQLRLSFGFDQIHILTPIVETRLRSGLLAARNMKVGHHSAYGQVMITLPMGYPKVPLIVDFEPSINHGQEENVVKQLRESFLQIASRKDEQYFDGDGYINAKNVLTAVLERLRETFPQYDSSESEPSHVPSQVTSVDDDQDIGDMTITFYCCRRCRYCLFDTTALQEHHGPGGTNVHSSKCTSLFLEESPSYVKIGDGTQQEGKINCPKCNSRVGSWSWIGSQCSCSAWIVPSYQFTKSKLDERKE